MNVQIQVQIPVKILSATRIKFLYAAMKNAADQNANLHAGAKIPMTVVKMVGVLLVP